MAFWKWTFLWAMIISTLHGGGTSLDQKLVTWVDAIGSHSMYHMGHRQKRNDLRVLDLESNFTDDGNNSQGANYTLLGGGNSRGITDKEIVVIVVCSAVGLVACLLGAALLASRVYWTKSRGDGAWYHGVAQRDSWDSSAPVDEGPQTSGTSPKETPADTCRSYSNTFGQLEEIDEESSSSPGRRSSVKPMSQEERKASLSTGMTTPQASTVNLVNVVHVESGESGDNVLLNHVPQVAASAALVQVDTRDQDTDVVAEKQMDWDASEADAPEQFPVIAGSISNLYKDPKVISLDDMRCKTGLSQSDCSISSFMSNNPSYQYGNQVAYMGGFYGYNTDETYSRATKPWTIPSTHHFLFPASQAASVNVPGQGLEVIDANQPDIDTYIEESEVDIQDLEPCQELYGVDAPLMLDIDDEWNEQENDESLALGPFQDNCNNHQIEDGDVIASEKRNCNTGDKDLASSETPSSAISC